MTGSSGSDTSAGSTGSVTSTGHRRSVGPRTRSEARLITTRRALVAHTNEGPSPISARFHAVARGPVPWTGGGSPRPGRNSCPEPLVAQGSCGIERSSVWWRTTELVSGEQGRTTRRALVAHTDEGPSPVSSLTWSRPLLHTRRGILWTNRETLWTTGPALWTDLGKSTYAGNRVRKPLWDRGPGP